MRQLVKGAIAASAPLEGRLARVERKLARKVPAQPSPERGFAIMRKGLAEVVRRKLIAREEAKPDPAERKPASASGKKATACETGG